MIKKILIFTVLSIMVFQAAAFAFETEGQVIFRDSLYGLAIGAIIGAAFYVADDREDFAQDVAAGVIVGTVAGLGYGLYETKSFVEIEKNKLKFAIPTPVIKQKNHGIQYSAYLLNTKF
jgi:hypothetical protein